MLTIEEHSREQWEILGLLTIIFLSKIDISYFQALYLILPIYYFFFWGKFSQYITNTLFWVKFYPRQFILCCVGWSI